MELWNNVCRLVREYKTQNIPESKVEELWMTVFMELGWSKIKGELIAQIEIPIGANNKLRPDILLKVNDKTMFVVELKRPNQELIDKHSNQLISYMLQLKMKIGILICSNLQIYYDDPSKNNSPQRLLSIEFIENNLKGIKLFELLNRANFSEKLINEYCSDLIEEQNDMNKAKKIADEIISSGEILEDIKKFLSNKYGLRISHHLLDLLNFRIEKKVANELIGGLKTSLERRERTRPLIIRIDDEKIGAKAKKLFGSSIADERFSLIEIRALCDAKYSKLNFGSGYPILKEITNFDSDSIRYDSKGRARYWKDKFYGYGKKFYITSQWYESQDSYLMSYFDRLNMNFETNEKKFEFDIDGETYKIILEPDEMSKYPHLVNLSTGYIAKNQKGICREFLKPYGFDVPLDAESFLTHDSIKLVYKVLNNATLSEKEKSIRKSL